MNRAKMTLVVLILGLITTTTRAKIWWVDSNPANRQNFTTVQAAHNAASPGDTIYVAGSTVSYGNLTMSKKLYIFGPGYFLTENPKTQARPLSAKVINVSVDHESNGSLITGMVVEGKIHFNTGEIIFKRNKVVLSANDLIEIGDQVPVTNIILKQNYILNTRTGYSGLSCIRVFDNCQNILVTNNFIDGAETPINIYAVKSSPLATLEILNNTIRGQMEIYNSLIHNNILREGNFFGADNNIQCNLGNDDQFGTDNGNQANIDMATVFSSGNSPDGQWQLSATSPAIGAGIGGQNCGMFGGSDPYVLSGLPALPTIYFFSAPASGSPTMNFQVSIKVKSQN